MDMIQSYQDSENSSDDNKPHHNSLNSKNTTTKLKKRNPSARCMGYISKRQRKQQLPSIPSTVADSDIKALPDINDNLFLNGYHMNNMVMEGKSKLPKAKKLVLRGHKHGINCVRWGSTEKNWHLLASASMDKTVKVWRVFDGQDLVCDQDDLTYVRSINLHTEAVKDIEWSIDGTHLYSSSFDKTVQFVDVQSNQIIDSYQHKHPITSICVHPHDPNLFLCGGEKSGIVCWDRRCHRVATTYQSYFNEVQDLCFLPGSSNFRFISSSSVTKRNSIDKVIMVWDFETGAVVSNQIYMEIYTCPSIRIHPEKDVFIAQSSGNYIAEFSSFPPYKLNRKKRYEGHETAGYHIQCSYNRNGSIIATGDSSGKIFYYDATSSKMIWSTLAHNSVCMDTEFHPKIDSILASCGWDGVINVFAATT